MRPPASLGRKRLPLVHQTTDFRQLLPPISSRHRVLRWGRVGLGRALRPPLELSLDVGKCLLELKDLGVEEEYNTV